jgi:hypothetical protein
MLIQNKNSLVSLMRILLDVIFVLGAAFSCMLIGLLLFGGIFGQQILHVYDPQLSVAFHASPLAATGIHPGTVYLDFGRWKTTMFAVETGSLGFLALQLAWIALQPGITLGVIWHLRKLVRSVEAGEPFQGQAAGRLRAIGLLIIAGAAGRPLEDFIAGVYAKSHYLFQRGSIELSFDVMGLLWGSAVGLMILVLAEVFRYGHTLHQEQELTV